MLLPAAFDWTDAAGNPTKGTTGWSIGPADGKHFAPSNSTFMVSYRVEDLDRLLKALREAAARSNTVQLILWPYVFSGIGRAESRSNPVGTNGRTNETNRIGERI